MREHCKKIVFLIPYPIGEAPSQRFRFEQYLPLLEAHQFKITLLPFFSKPAWGKLYSKGDGLYRTIYTLWALVKRLFQIAHTIVADFVFIHREAAPVGPPIIEWIVAVMFRKKIIFDFDDAIWLSDKKKEPLLIRLIRSRSKVATICQWSYKISCGNDYLYRYASQYNTRVVLNPTTIQMTTPKNFLTKETKNSGNKIVIGWTGSHSTLKYLEQIEPLLQEIELRHSDVYFLTIADKTPVLNLTRWVHKQWHRETEVSDLFQADIGIMPMPDNDWTRGKCGFKALQYMSLMIPPVVSPVGVNCSIIKHGVNGFLCGTDDEWIKTLGLLIEDQQLRERIGKAAQKTVNDQFSVVSNAANFLSLFE